MALVNFTEAELKALREISRRVLGGQINFGRGVAPPDTYEDHTSPEVYIAKAPDEGIPALVAGDTGTGTGSYDKPGSAVCELYAIGTLDESPNLHSINRTELVYNLTESPITNDSPILVVRDKFGRWVAVLAPYGRRRFVLTSELDDSGGAEEVDGGGIGTGVNFEVYDPLAIFGVVSSGTYGLAEYWNDNGHWEIYQMSCPAAGTGTGTGTG